VGFLCFLGIFFCFKLLFFLFFQFCRLGISDIHWHVVAEYRAAFVLVSKYETDAVNLGLFFEVIRLLRLLGGCDDAVTNSAVSGNLWRQDCAGGISFLLVFTLGKSESW
jgi:hypothetical protein